MVCCCHSDTLRVRSYSYRISYSRGTPRLRRGFSKLLPRYFRSLDGVPLYLRCCSGMMRCQSGLSILYSGLFFRCGDGYFIGGEGQGPDRKELVVRTV